MLPRGRCAPASDWADVGGHKACLRHARLDPVEVRHADHRHHPARAGLLGAPRQRTGGAACARGSGGATARTDREDGVGHVGVALADHGGVHLWEALLEIRHDVADRAPLLERLRRALPHSPRAAPRALGPRSTSTVTAMASLSPAVSCPFLPRARPVMRGCTRPAQAQPRGQRTSCRPPPQACAARSPLSPGSLSWSPVCRGQALRHRAGAQPKAPKGQASSHQVDNLLGIRSGAGRMRRGRAGEIRPRARDGGATCANCATALQPEASIDSWRRERVFAPPPAGSAASAPAGALARPGPGSPGPSLVTRPESSPVRRDGLRG